MSITFIIICSVMLAIAVLYIEYLSEKRANEIADRTIKEIKEELSEKIDSLNFDDDLIVKSDVNTCVYCGATIPEGSQVCPDCEEKL